MLGCGRLTTKLGSGSSVGYIWCIRLSPLAWYLAQSVARLYTCLLPHRCAVFSSCFNSSLFSKVQWQWSCPYANAKTPALHYRCSFLSLSLPPAARRTHVEDRCSPLPHKPTFRTNKKNRFLWLPCCQSRSK